MAVIQQSSADKSVRRLMHFIETYKVDNRLHTVISIIIHFKSKIVIIVNPRIKEFMTLLNGSLFCSLYR